MRLSWNEHQIKQVHLITTQPELAIAINISDHSREGAGDRVLSLLGIPHRGCTHGRTCRTCVLRSLVISIVVDHSFQRWCSAIPRAVRRAEARIMELIVLLACLRAQDSEPHYLDLARQESSSSLLRRLPMTNCKYFPITLHVDCIQPAKYLVVVR